MLARTQALPFRCSATIRPEVLRWVEPQIACLQELCGVERADAADGVAQFLGYYNFAGLARGEWWEDEEAYRRIAPRVFEPYRDIARWEYVRAFLAAFGIFFDTDRRCAVSECLGIENIDSFPPGDVGQGDAIPEVRFPIRFSDLSAQAQVDFERRCETLVPALAELLPPCTGDEVRNFLAQVLGVREWAGIAYGMHQEEKYFNGARPIEPQRPWRPFQHLDDPVDGADLVLLNLRLPLTAGNRERVLAAFGAAP